MASDSYACGGCFAPAEPPTVVSGHRMVMSVSPTQTVLWDQIQYAGDPAEFAWVLPVKPGARVEASTAAFFEVLEANTATRIIPPPLDCGGSGQGCGTVLAAADSESGGNFDEGDDPLVDVVHQGTVGPYETVTLSTETPGALNAWLDDHGYNVDDQAQPIIDQYVADGFDFIALRLQPGKGVSQMTPVRVVMDGGAMTLPLRMVGIGTGEQTPIVLYVIGEGRYTSQNFAEAKITTGLLSWNFKTQESNYTTLREKAFAEHDGRAFLTTFAQPHLFDASFYDPNTGESISLPALYADQAFKNGEIEEACEITALPASGRVKNPCPPGEPPDSAACGAVETGDVDARTLGCDGATDVAVALEGLSVSNIWVTRLEAVLPRAALVDDLTLQASTVQEPFSRDLQASIALEPDGACPSGVLPRVIDVSAPPRSPFALFAGATLAGLGAALAARRVRLRRRRV
ncbi:MAG: DUF2330 domain-containing protein [Myxococcales bacterium]|nr:DUF2330 domain-containing protein [Myxococcales bacterium]